eukprot:7003184-Lingulodinium_polyedra.AAC.1
MLRDLFASIRASGSAPRQFNFSLACRVHKKSISHEGEQYATEDARTVHAFGSLPKLFMRRVWARLEKPRPPDHAYGCVSGRRREEAILVQACVHWRLVKSGHCTLLRLHDVRNAFPSPDMSAVLECVESMEGDDFAKSMLVQHCTQHITLIQASDGNVMVQQGSGTPQGSIAATGVFNP